MWEVWDRRAPDEHVHSYDRCRFAQLDPKGAWSARMRRQSALSWSVGSMVMCRIVWRGRGMREYPPVCTAHVQVISMVRPHPAPPLIPPPSVCSRPDRLLSLRLMQRTRRIRSHSRHVQRKRKGEGMIGGNATRAARSGMRPESVRNERASRMFDGATRVINPGKSPLHHTHARTHLALR